MAELVDKKFDMVLTSLKVNSEREGAVDFTAPFLESGTSILVTKRTGIISPTAFLEPFDPASWMMVVIAAVQVSALTIFFFEWLSPAGYNMKATPEPDHKFSLFRTYWMVWALLFQAPVNMDVPRAFTARFMASVWALFAVVFLAIYTANLAAFMITREEWYDFTGLNDKRLLNPLSQKPPLKFGTIPWTYTDGSIKKMYPTMHEYMKQYNKRSVIEGINSVKRGDLNAFIYDATVLEYLVAQDEECKLLTVGTWHAMTGYGAAFPRNSKHFRNFNRKIMDYSENGDLERLRRFWLTGTCNPKKEEKKASEPLAPEQFLSAFLILLCGIFLAIGLMGVEHGYMKWVRGAVDKKDKAGCFALVSLSVGKSLSFRGTVYEASELIKTHRCRDPICDTHLWKVRHELDLARMKMQKLELQLKAEENNESGDGGLSTEASEDEREPSSQVHQLSQGRAVQLHQYKQEGTSKYLIQPRSRNSKENLHSESTSRNVSIEFCEDEVEEELLGLDEEPQEEELNDQRQVVSVYTPTSKSNQLRPNSAVGARLSSSSSPLSKTGALKKKRAIFSSSSASSSPPLSAPEQKSSSTVEFCKINAAATKAYPPPKLYEDKKQQQQKKALTAKEPRNGPQTLHNAINLGLKSPISSMNSSATVRVVNSRPQKAIIHVQRQPRGNKQSSGSGGTTTQLPTTGVHLNSSTAKTAKEIAEIETVL